MEKPDSTLFRAQIECLKSEIERYANRINEIKEIQENRSKNALREKSPEDEIKKEIKDIRDKFVNKLGEKRKIQKELSELTREKDNIREQIKKIREEIKFASLEEIDSEIKRLEEKINQEVLSDEKEASYLEEIRYLANSREKVRILKEKLEFMQQDEKNRDNLIQKLKKLDNELDQCKVKENEEKYKLSQIKNFHEANILDENALKDEKNKCWEVMRALKDKKKEIEKRFDSEMKEYKILETTETRKKEKLERERKKKESIHQQKPDIEQISEKQNEPKQQKLKSNTNIDHDKQQGNFTSTPIIQEKEMKDFKKKTRTLKSEDNYHDSRIFTCDQLILYLSKYVVHNKAQDIKDENINSGAPEIGMELLKKNDDSDIFKFKGIKNKSRKGKKHAKEENLEFKSLTHSFDIFQSFHSIKVSVPNSISEVPRAIEDIKLKKRIYTGEIIEKDSESLSCKKVDQQIDINNNYAAQTLSKENENLGLVQEEVKDMKQADVEFIVTDSSVKISLKCHEEYNY